ncbi:MAG: hypothetical protein K8T26_01570 [Lentisphaerae bacterium]|nr:hypothetical protein [Lentisphaerota bacterium]
MSDPAYYFAKKGSEKCGHKHPTDVSAAVCGWTKWGFCGDGYKTPRWNLHASPGWNLYTSEGCDAGRHGLLKDYSEAFCWLRKVRCYHGTGSKYDLLWYAAELVRGQNWVTVERLRHNECLAHTTTDSKPMGHPAVVAEANQGADLKGIVDHMLDEGSQGEQPA